MDASLQAYLTLVPDQALAAAEQADQQRKSGEERPLLGIPMGIKDVLSTRDVETTCGSKILKGYQPVFSATSIERLQQAGMVMLGKLNMD
ncbi:MAG: Asp-tRNA(Asn)/Glu-tRNA(Gln) amidotransferase GatCAB subunit A, partial [Anaerolineae bacterium]|nr:Asp-tRNA(Asn)/Glu-tRNA(Gln) amidotransferase GatCAB subunit A [Anaerolineae bacterium]